MYFNLLPSLTDTSPMNTMSSFMLAQQANTMALQSIWYNNAYMNSYYSTMPMNMSCNCNCIPFPSYLNPNACIDAIVQRGITPNINYSQIFSNSSSASASNSNQTPSSAVINTEDTAEVRKQKKQLEASVNLAKELINSNKISSNTKIALEAALDNYDAKETLEEKNVCLKEAINKIPENVIKDIVASASSDFITVDGTNIGDYLREIGSIDINDSSNKSMRDSVNSTRESLKTLTEVNTLSNGAVLLGVLNTRSHADQVLNIISSWNTERGSDGKGGFIESLYAKYQNKDNKLDNPEQFWNEAIVPYITALTDKAESICELVNDDALKAKINNAKDNLSKCKEPGKVDLVKAFNELYVILRRTAAQVADDKLKEEYGYLEKDGGNFKTDVYSTMTNKDLQSEGFGNNFANTPTETTGQVKKTLDPKYKDIVEAAYNNCKDINKNEDINAGYIRVYHAKVIKGNFPENGDVGKTLKEMQNLAEDNGMDRNCAKKRYNMALSYLNNAIKEAIKYDKKRDGISVNFEYNVGSNTHNSTVRCSQVDTENKKDLEKPARKYISGKDSDGISVALSKNKDSDGKRQVAIAINWAEIYHRFFESDKVVYC